jgi:hypothetical protein
MISCSFSGGEIIRRVITEISGLRISVNSGVARASAKLPFSVGVMNKSLMVAFESERYTFSLSRDIGAIGSAEKFTLALLDRVEKTYTTASAN